MKTPEEKYLNDLEYRHLVNTVEALIHEAKFTPSEIREACMLGCIHYEQHRIRKYFIDEATGQAIDIINKFCNTAGDRPSGLNRRRL